MQKDLKHTVRPYLASLAFLAHPLLWLGMAFVVGIGLIFVSMVFQDRPENAVAVGDKDWWLTIGEKIGYILAVSGIIGVISRTLWATGVFRKVISDVMMEDGFWDIRNDLPLQWRKLTKRLYLPDFTVRSDDDRAFLDRVNQAMSKSISQRHNFYARDMDVHYRVEQVPDAPDCLKLTKTIAYALYPYDPDSEIEHVTQAMAMDGVELDAYAMKEISFRYKDGDEYVEVPRPAKIIGNKMIRTARLSGKDRYDIKRVTEALMPYREDPVSQFSAPYVIDRLTFRATCDAPGVTTFFSEVGVEETFEDGLDADPEARRRGNQHRVFKGVLLPEQGFVFVVQVGQPG